MYFRYAGIGLNYQRLHWDDMDGVEMKAQATALDYITNADGFVDRGLGLLFYGHQGTGKTMLVSLGLKRLLAHGFDGYFTTFQRLISSFSAGWHDEVQRGWFTRRITNATILVIDDVGKEFKGERRQGDAVVRRPVEMVQAMFDEVIRSRVENCRPTLMTTNKTLLELERLYDNTGTDSVQVNPMSLFQETMLFQEFNGDNYRTSDGSATKRAAEVRQGLTRPIRW
jgi:DNA replication protein DnaC